MEKRKRKIKQRARVWCAITHDDVLTRKSDAQGRGASPQKAYEKHKLLTANYPEYLVNEHS